jgi:hypothetical protein
MNARPRKPSLGGRTYDDYKGATPPEYSETRGELSSARCPVCQCRVRHDQEEMVRRERRCPSCAMLGRDRAAPAFASQLVKHAACKGTGCAKCGWSGRV